MSVATAPVTARQVEYIRLLAEGHGTKLPTEEQIATWTQAKASDIIGWYLQKFGPLPRKEQGSALKEGRAVPAGHYALDIEGTVHFFKVDTPDEGRWAGFTFVKEQASDDYWPVKGQRKGEVLRAIAEDVEGALARYGHLIGRCGICNRTLTDEESRERGIGPVCASKL